MANSTPSNENNRKRKHVSLTIIEKIEIIKKLDCGASTRFLAHAYGISPRTIYDIKKQKEKLLNFYMNRDHNAGIAERKSMHAAKSGELDKVLYEWFKQRRSEGLHITGPLLCEKARDLHKELNIEVPYIFSTGWLTRFKQRYGIRLSKTSDEKISAEEFDSFPCVIKEEPPSPEQNNMDETGRFWCSTTPNILATVDEKNQPRVKEEKQQPNTDSSSETDSDEEKISLEEGLAIGEKYLNFLMQHNFISLEEIMTVQKLQDKIRQRCKKLKLTTVLSRFAKYNGM